LGAALADFPPSTIVALLQLDVSGTPAVGTVDAVVTPAGACSWADGADEPPPKIFEKKPVTLDPNEPN
jgi:hypothetical protein